MFKRYYNKMFLNDVRRALEDYKMIENGDRVGVGISGGKDSITLLFILNLLKKYSYMSFELYAINIDIGFGINMQPIIDFCSKNEIKIVIEHTNIYDTVFNDRKEKNPCSLCSKLRKGALSRVAIDMNINKIALGHTATDAIETLLMNTLLVGKLGSFKPYIEQKDKSTIFIRPLIYVKEDTILDIVKLEELPVVKNLCLLAGNTKRQEMKALLYSLIEKYPDAQNKIITSLQNVDMNNLWKQRN